MRCAHAGPVDRYLAGIPRQQRSSPDGDDQRPPRSAYQHHSFCQLCRGHKPPHAHHCRCVMACAMRRRIVCLLASSE